MARCPGDPALIAAIPAMALAGPGRYNGLMPSVENPLREELEEAIAKVRHQMEAESSPSGAEALGPVQRRSLLDELGSELARLEEALAGLADGEA